MSKASNKIVVTTKCLSCGKEFSETLGRLKRSPEPRCSACGGKLDPEPIRELARNAIEGLKAAFEVAVKRRKFKKD